MKSTVHTKPQAEAALPQSEPVLNFRFNINKALCSIGYILNKINTKVDFHKVFKIIYFADKRHLVEYGSPISGDFFIAMENGPVPSNIYDLFKEIRRNLNTDKNMFNEYFSVENRYYISLKTSPDFSHLSKSDVECLEYSINENKDLDFSELTDKSHDSAYKKADINNEINFLEMAKDGGADEKTIKYIISISENQAIRA